MTPADYLTPRGKEIFKAIAKHCAQINKELEVFSFEASLLANSLDLHERAANEINKKGGQYKQTSRTGWDQTTSDYAVLNKEYQNIMKHAPKFGINPKDLLAKIKEAEDAQTRISKLRKAD